MIRNFYIRMGLRAIRAHKPEGVAVERADGESIPVKLRFVGIDRDGIYRWMIVPPTNTGRIVALTADAVPGRTAVGWPAHMGFPRGVKQWPAS